MDCTPLPRSLRSWQILVGGLIVAFCSLNIAQADVDSGPTVGEKVPELKVLPLTGPLEGKEPDYAAERAGKPTIYLLIPNDRFARPVARFMKTLDGKATEAGDEAYIVAVWLTDDQNATKTYLPRVQQSLQLDHTALTVHPGEKTGPTGWGVNSDAHLTAVVSDGKNVTACFGLVSLNETNVPDVLTAWKKAAHQETANPSEKK